MRVLRLWSVRHAVFLDWVYRRFEQLLPWLDPLIRRIGYSRAEPTVTILERSTKGALFDCQMCGECILGSTGLSCPMNCPKQMRNGPCGGVRANGNCEIDPRMKCVWVLAHEGDKRLARDGLNVIQPGLNWREKGRSSWLKACQGKARQS